MMKAIKVDDEQLRQVQENAVAAVRTVSSGPLSGARLSAPTTVTTTDTRVYHNLGRAIKGCIPCLPSANAVFYAGSPSAEPTKFVNIKASATATALFLFF